MWYGSKFRVLCVCFCVWYASICDSVVFLCLSMYDERQYTGQCCIHGTVVFMYLFLSGYCYASVCDNSVFLCVFSGGSPHESPRNLSPNQHVSFAFQAIRKSVFPCVPVFNDVIL